MKIKLLLIHYFLKPHIKNHDKIQSTFDTGAISVQIIFVRSLKSQLNNFWQSTISMPLQELTPKLNLMMIKWIWILHIGKRTTL